MEIEALLIQSLQLLGLGMGSVFIILLLLIAIVSIVAKIVPEEAPAMAPIPEQSTTVDQNHIAAITAAIKQYRKNR